MYGWTVWEVLSSGRPISFYDLFVNEAMDAYRIDVSLESASKEGRFRFRLLTTKIYSSF